MATVFLLSSRCALAPGHGAERAALALLEALARRGDACHSLALWCSGAPPRAGFEPRRVGAAAGAAPLWARSLAGVMHWRAEGGSEPDAAQADAQAQGAAAPAWAAAVRATLAHLRPDLVLELGEPGLAPLVAAARQRGARVLSYLADPVRALAAPAELAARDGWLCPSRAMAQRCQQRLGLRPEVLRDLVAAPPAGLDNLAPERLGARAGRAVTLFHPEPEKGGLWFVNLAAQMLKQAPELRFVALGGRWGPAQWQAAGVDLAALPNLSWQPEPEPGERAALWQDAALLLVPSLAFEASGPVVAEGLLAGVPVLAMRSGGLPEQLNGGGFLFDIPLAMRGNVLNAPQVADLRPWVHCIRSLLLGSPALYREAVQLALNASQAFARGRTEPALYAAVDRCLARPAGRRPVPGVALPLLVPSAPPQAPFRLRLESTRSVPGHLHGLAQPALVAQVWLSRPPAAGLGQRLLAALAPHLPAAPEPPRGTQEAPAADAPSLSPAELEAWDAQQLLQAVASLVGQVQEAAGLTVLAPAQLLPLGGRRWSLVLPGPAPEAAREALAWTASAVHALLLEPSRHEPAPDQLDPPRVAGLASMLKRLARLAPGGSNPRHFLRTAHALGMPVVPLPGRVFQFGWGRHARLFRSSLSDATGAVATAWAKDKRATNLLLGMAGLPVPAQVEVLSLAAAIEAAKAMGYPVVLKPGQLDQGLGVEAGLMDEAELRPAYQRARQHAQALLLEKHVPGNDYRVYVVQGELVAVAQRIPAQVVGDGVASVEALVAQTNQARLSAPERGAQAKPIVLDDEALALLSRAGLATGSVPARGQPVALCRSANVSRGGRSVDVTALVHPDNAALCVRAAALLRLDIAGLDLLMPDIARSWREGGAAFCEANAQPQMGGAHPWIFGHILRRFVPGRGRIAAVLVLGDGSASGLARAIVARLAGAGLQAGLAEGAGVALLESSRAALIDPGLGAIVVHTDGAGLADTGLPLDRFDVLAVGCWPLPLAQQAQRLALVAPHLAGTALVQAGGAADLTGDTAPACQDWLAQALGPQRVQAAADEAALCEAVCALVCGLPDGG